MPVIYGYCRVSSLGQVRVGKTLETQREELTAAGAEKIYADVYSGTKADRPELDHLLGKLERDLAYTEHGYHRRQFHRQTHTKHHVELCRVGKGYDYTALS